MSGPSRPDSPPPEVPEEFADAYRAAYERALAAQPEGPQHRQDRPRDPEPAEEPEQRDEPPTLEQPRHAAPAPEPTPAPTAQDEPTTEQPVPRATTPTRRRAAPVPADEPEDDEQPTAFERIRDSRWFVPLLLALLAALLIVGAYAVGRAFSGRVSNDAKSQRSTDPSVVMSEGPGSQKPQPVSRERPEGGAWDGAVARVGGVRASSGCTYRTGVDASGARVTYGPEHLTDGTADTTWRCDGSAVGRRITLDLGRDVSVGEVGLIPGYAKTDEANGADRYAENNRITRVRWTIGRTKVEQKMSGTPSDRSLRLLRVPRTTASRVTLEILAVTKGPRETTAISEITIGRAR